MKRGTLTQWCCSGALAALCLLARSARADEHDVDAMARVTASESELRAGPGLSYRVVHRAARGDTFAIQGREATGFWLRVYLADGRTAYLLGDTADTIALGEGDESPAPGFFSPPPLATARGGLSMGGGIFSGAGYAELKPSLVIAASLALEPYVGIVMGTAGRSLVYGAGLSVHLAPEWAVCPYLTLGAGGYTTLPNDDAFALRERSMFHGRAGGGVSVAMPLRIVLRLEAMNNVLFDADAYRNAQSYLAGLGSYF